MSCDGGLRPFFCQYSAVSVLGDVTLLLQIAYLTAIAMLVEKLSADQANIKHEKWVRTAVVVSISCWGGLLLRGLQPFGLKCCDCNSSFCWNHRDFAINASKGHPELLRWPHLHISIHPHSPKPLGEVWTVVSSGLPFLRFLHSMVSEHVMCALSYIIPCLNRNN